jgi:hypothetical protein
MARDRIEEAYEIGEKNKQTAELVRNWCAHVSIKKMGGVGMVEQMSGLPIGPHALQCPHAAAGGMGTWDMVDAALDFYDRNCVDCKFRKPVGLPNISTLIAARDERRKQKRLEDERAEQAEADKLAAREKTRQAIRAELAPVPATTLDLISELDRERSKAAAAKLVQTAGLAADSFPLPIIEHLFELVESREHGLVEPVLDALAQLPVDKKRLCNTALRNLFGARRTAAKIIEQYGEYGDEELIAPALPALISLASPQHYPFAHESPEPVAGPLQELYSKRPASVRDGLKIVLGRTEAHNAALAARGIAVLSEQDSSLLLFATDELMAKLARAKWLTQGREEEVSGALGDIRRTLVMAFDAAPQKIDSAIGDYLHGASKEGTAELYHLYQDVLHRARRLSYNEEDEDKEKLTEAHRIAFRRLVNAVTAQDDEDRSDIALGVFSGDPYELTPIVAEEIDLLLGSAAIIATRLQNVSTKSLDPKNPLAGMERMGLTSRLNGLMNSFVRWACVAAGKAGPAAIDKVLTMMRGLPADNNEPRATIVGHFHNLARTTEGLMQILPDYYSALVGSSQVVRSDAATTLGEMSRAALENMPSLVFEAFTALMADPYIIVHRAAVRALRRFSLPDAFRRDAVRAFTGWILSYADSRNDDRFLIQALELYAYRYVSKEQLAGPLGDRLMDIAMTVAPDVLLGESRNGLPVFSGNPNYARFFLHLLEDDRAMATYHEHLLEEFQRRPPASLYTERARAVEVGIKVARSYPWGAMAFIEALTACGAWGEAATLAAAVHEGVPDTTEYRPRRLHFDLFRIATAFEAAIAEGQTAELDTLAQQWRETLADIRKDHDENERRRDPLQGFLGSN